MKKSESIGEITKALAKFKGELPEIKLNSTVEVKTKSGGSYSFRYADLPHIKNIADPILSKNGLFVAQFPESGGELTTLISHESGEFMESITNIGSVEGKTAQEYGSLITYFKRYAYCAVLGIAADDDDDANSNEGNGFTKTTVNPNAPWLTEQQYNDTIAAIGKGKMSKESLDTLFKEFRMKKVYKEEIQKSFASSEKKATGKPDILPDTPEWTKTVVWLSKKDEFIMDLIDKVKDNYTISEDNIEKLVKEVEILKKKEVKEPSTDDKVKSMKKQSA